MRTIFAMAILFVGLFIADQPVQGADSTNVDNGRDKLMFKPQEQADQTFKQEDLEMRSSLLRQEQAQGHIPFIWEVNNLKLDYQLLDSGVSITNYNSWMKTFNAQVLNPAVVFDVRDALPIDFSTPIAAEQSYRRAKYDGDASTLLNNSDENGKFFMEHILFVDKSKKVTSYEIFKRLSHFTVLLTATYNFQGYRYTLVLVRAQEYEKPKDGIVILQVDMFKQVGDRFLFTGDINTSCGFGNIFDAAHTKMSFLEHYPKFYEHNKCSALPPSFYTIEEPAK
jgi:hypothetical protein